MSDTLEGLNKCLIYVSAPLLFAYINTPLTSLFQAKMGFKEGEGLGKYSQGRKDIVEASNQKGRRGLGLTLQGFDQELNVNWRDEPEVPHVERRWEGHLCFYETILTN